MSTSFAGEALDWSEEAIEIRLEAMSSCALKLSVAGTIGGGGFTRLSSTNSPAAGA
eukprot:SAG11_NODE_13347_length_659_cov_0.816071_2_plen_55_part_01